MINKRYADFLPSLQSSEELMIQVDEVSTEMDALKNCIENEVWLHLKPTSKNGHIYCSAYFVCNVFVFVHMDADTAKYPGGRDWVCKAEAAAWKKYCHYRSAGAP